MADVEIVEEEQFTRGRLKIKGVHGTIKVGPRVAATFSSWSLVTEPPPAPIGRYRFEATAATSDSFLLTQAPHDVSVTVGTRTWRWRGVHLAIAGARIEAIVPRPEVLK